MVPSDHAIPHSTHEENRAVRYGNHRELILNYFRRSKSYVSGVRGGLEQQGESPIEKIVRFRTYRVLELRPSITHLGQLPEPASTTISF